MGQLYHAFFPKQAVGANLVYFDLFNAATSAADVLVRNIKPVVSGAVAVVGTLGVDLHLTRTTAVGTGGTAAVAESTALTATPAITKLDPDGPSLPAGITARLTPGGGATGGAALGWASVFTEETNVSAYFPVDNLVEDGPLSVPGGTGLRVVQGAVASVGNIGFNVLFEVIPK